MTSFALICPQCGGPLPRQAMWRMVTCPHCKAVVTQSSAVVQRSVFRDALQRSRDGKRDGRRTIDAGGQAYAIVATLGTGRASTVLLADRVGRLPGRVVVKLARDVA
ncbi:MAG: protein kinase family protein, partial [Pseudomonadota bacterium]|nr:protein kinase family protein [Pseudomonadota bacterium]